MAKQPNWTADSCKCAECTASSPRGRSSVDLLLAWITAIDAVSGRHCNWDRYKGATKTKTGVSKRTLANEISTILARHGLLRDVPGISWKITDL